MWEISVWWECANKTKTIRLIDTYTRIHISPKTSWYKQKFCVWTWVFIQNNNNHNWILLAQVIWHVKWDSFVMHNMNGYHFYWKTYGICVNNDDRSTCLFMQTLSVYTETKWNQHSNLIQFGYYLKITLSSSKKLQSQGYFWCKRIPKGIWFAKNWVKKIKCVKSR